MKEFNGKVTGDAMTIVNSTNTAVAAQSGSLPVLGTPFLIALMEKATCRAVMDLLEDSETTVGTNIDVSHKKASSIGKVIKAHAYLAETDGRKLTFEVTAKEEGGAEVGSGIIERFVVNEEKFMKKAETK